MATQQLQDSRCNAPRSVSRKFARSGWGWMAGLSLSICVGVTGGFWVVDSAIAPQVAQAYTARVDLVVNRRADESYETLLRRAEAAARAAAQQSFDREILVTEVAVMVVAESDGATVPLLEMEVTRAQWRNRPDPQQWASYFRSARSLLGFDRPLTSNTPTPAPAPTPLEDPTSGQSSPQTPMPPVDPNQSVTPDETSPDLTSPLQPTVPRIPRQRG